MGVACAVIVLAGVVHGKLTQRWGPGGQLEKAAATLASFPESFGDWRLEDSSPMEPAVVEMLQCADYVNNAYMNSRTGEVVRVALIVGPSGPTAVHTPEICYSSRAYEIIEEAQRNEFAVDGVKHAFWGVRFKSSSPGGAGLKVYYAWTADQAWRASEAPRYEYAGAPYLWKIQIAGAMGAADDSPSNDPCRRFIEDLLRDGWKPQAADS
ncbi:exosortase-associated EpsI family protein [Pseudobythopirellula maris]|uniref:exosortase-associated EpsI family protein n=1 Tax=Pseudobythopirellula maris TaxID=2527991 RepID=UPI0018D39F32|nr:exosortase-associated EpsI family protein [Pseudobythopirellula maris]